MTDISFGMVQMLETITSASDSEVFLFGLKFSDASSTDPAKPI